ncbi:MAG: Crp/Fnr family transcriptional regulator [Flavobacteriales bacterium]
MTPLNQNCTDCPVKDCFIQKGCNKEWLNILSDRKTMVTFDKGKEIIHEGNPVFGIYFIYSGKVKVTSTGFNDKRQIVRFTKEGDILGHRGYGGEIYPINAEAMERSEVCFIDNETVHEAFMENVHFTFNLMMYYSKELRNTEARMKYLAQMTVREKVVEALLYIGKVYGEDEGKRGLRLDIERREVGEFAGVNADQVSRVLSILKEEDTLTTDAKKLFIKSPSALYSEISEFLPLNSEF